MGSGFANSGFKLGTRIEVHSEGDARLTRPPSKFLRIPLRVRVDKVEEGCLGLDRLAALVPIPLAFLFGPRASGLDPVL
jgi:hypothetical protein